MKNITTIEIQSYLRGVDYPVRKEGLILAAKENSAPTEVKEALEELPDSEYHDAAEVSHELGILHPIEEEKIGDEELLDDEDILGEELAPPDDIML